MGDRFGIELDYCPQCRGIWLEKGKLDRIVERSPAAAVAAVAAAPAQQAARPEYHGEYRDHDDHHHDDHGYERDSHGRRKKSFLSGLFD
jgi:Zn-finger nucleic acid-binding protein